MMTATAMPPAAAALRSLLGAVAGAVAGAGGLGDLAGMSVGGCAAAAADALPGVTVAPGTAAATAAAKAGWFKAAVKAAAAAVALTLLEGTEKVAVQTYDAASTRRRLCWVNCTAKLIRFSTAIPSCLAVSSLSVATSLDCGGADAVT